jgi:hypothetical protein
MHELIDRLIEDGYSGVAVESFTEKEETGGYQDEHKYWRVVARDPVGNPVRISAERHIRFGPGARSSRLQKGADTPLSEAEYVAVVDHKGVVDTDEYRRRLAARRADEERRRQEIATATAELDKVRPLCPSCQARMVPRHSAYGWFWGCRSFPNCRGTKNMSAAARDLVKRGAS